MHQITLFQDKKSKNFLKGGTAASPDPIHNGEGAPPPHAPLPAAPTALDTSSPVSKILDPPLQLTA